MAKQPQRRPAPATTTASQKTAPAQLRDKTNRKSLFNTGSNELIFGKENFTWIGIGLLLVLVGLATMLGGKMPSPDVWQPEIIYSNVRITLAPILMLAGFAVVIFGIFKKDKSLNSYQKAAESNSEIAA